MTRRRTHEEFVQLMAELHPNYVVMGSYIDANTPVHMYCKICGQYSDPRPSNLLGSKNSKPTGCRYCAKNVAKTNDLFLKEVSGACPTVEPLDPYPGNNKIAIRFRCKLCGNTWTTASQSVLQGHGCKLCTSKSTGFSQRVSQEEYVARVDKINPDIIILGEYTGAHSSILAECKRCNHRWYPIAQNLVNGSGCPKCGNQGTSFTERFIYHAFRECFGEHRVLSRDKRAIGMELDIFVPDLSFAVEPGGWYWHKSFVEKDTKKRELCREHGIRLITIYDGFAHSNKPFSEDCYTYKCDLGNRRNRKVLRRLVSDLIQDAGAQCVFSESQWRRIAQKANPKNELDEEAFRRFIEDNAPDIEVFDDYNGSRAQVSMRCSRGHEFITVPIEFLKRPRCPKCASQHASQKRMLTQQEFEARVASVNPNLVVTGTYKGMGHPVEVKCLTCKRVWEPRAKELVQGYGCGNRVCKKLVRQRQQELSSKAVDES